MSGNIAQAVERIRNTVLGSNLDESATKLGIVLNLLHLAGWRTFDVSEVVPEYTIQYRRVDFALRPNTANTIFVEVKRLGEDLTGHQQQLLEYCFQEGVRLAVLTNGQDWWLYLPLQQGSWDQRRFLTIDLATQEAGTVEQHFIRYLSQERVISGQAVSDAENMVRARQRSAAAYDSIAKAWSQIVGTPDDILVDLISETAERICGFKPDSALIRQFLSQRARSPEASRERRTPQSPGRTAAPPQGNETRIADRRTPLPITLDPSDPDVFKTALLRSKEAWIVESHHDGRKELRHWRAPNMTLSSNVLGNLRSKQRYRQGVWQKLGIASIHVTIDRPSATGQISE